MSGQEDPLARLRGVLAQADACALPAKGAGLSAGGRWGITWRDNRNEPGQGHFEAFDVSALGYPVSTPVEGWDPTPEAAWARWEARMLTWAEQNEKKAAEWRADVARARKARGLS